MIEMVSKIFRLSSATSTNVFIYYLRQLPFIKKVISNKWYKNERLKAIANGVMMVIKAISAFAGKFIYVALMVMLPATIFKEQPTLAFVEIFLFLTIIGGFANNELLNPSKEKYYAFVLMRMDAKSYALASNGWFLIKTLVTFYPAVMVLGLIMNVPLRLCLLLPILVVSIKIICSNLLFMYFEKTDSVITENNFKVMMIIIGIGLFLAYGLPAMGLYIPYIVIYGIWVLCLIISGISYYHLYHSNSYKRLYKKMITLNNVIFNTQEAAVDNQQKQMANQLQNTVVDVNKQGYAYFNEIFIRRHHKILTSSAKKFALVYLAIFSVITVVLLLNPEGRGRINEMMLTSLPYFVFIMYLTNRGSIVTQAMFMNCDHSMLTYRFYRKPDVILQLFKERLLSLCKINMIPSIIIACGLPFLLWITGGTVQPLNYLLLFVSILAMSIFFSVHYLVIYYLLQPYTMQMKQKSTLYGLINFATYFLCYCCIQLRISTFWFASGTIFFCTIYILIALYLVYKQAPKTFKLK